ncbi:hypothetical protein BC332_29861 [Capsicum chinense]|nr:hypothetical protein BC332_29861 [Capsicum chinense]
MDKVMRFVFYDDFVNKNIAFRDEDLYEIELVYFISRFLHSELPRTFIKKVDFDLVESGHYLKYDWEGECFQVLKKSCSHKMKKNPSSFHFRGFHLALQIWFYEYCLDIEKCVANRIGSQTSRVLNWESSEELIFMTIFRVQCSSGTTMSDIVFTDEEELEFNLGAIHQDSLGHEHRSNDLNHSVPPITEDAFFVLKNEIANVRRHMSLFQEKSFYWILVIFRIRHRCLYVYDSMMEGVVHSKNVLDHVRSLSTIIPLFLIATNFYGKRSNIDWHREAAYIDKSLSEPLEYVILKDTPQQGPQSNDCGMFVCAFAEYVSHGIFDISSTLFGAMNHRLRYGALLWNYVTQKKQNDGAVSESEATENVTSKHGDFKRSREQFGISRTE